MEDLKHWTVYIRQRAEHIQHCFYCKSILGQLPPQIPDCLDYTLLTGKIDMSFKKWLTYGETF